MSSPPPPPYHSYEHFPLPPADDSIQQQSRQLIAPDEPAGSRSVIDQLTKRRPKSGVVLSIVLNVITLVLIVVTGLVSLAVFATKENEIHSETKYNDDENGFCILYAKFSSDELSLGKSQACVFVIYGEAFVSFCAVAVILFACVHLWIGKWLSCLLVFEFIFLTAGIVAAFFVGAVLSIGFSSTCSAVIENAGGDVSCLTTVIGGDVTFYTSLHIAEITAWLSFGVLSMLTLADVVGTLVVFLVGRKVKIHRPMEHERFDY